MYLDDTYLESDKFVIERPATDNDTAEHPDEHSAFVACQIPLRCMSAIFSSCDGAVLAPCTKFAQISR
jgi:hypothetical protein